MGIGASVAVWSLFIIAGILVGGTWSFYQQGHRGVTIILGIVAAVALAAALIVLLTAMP